MTCYTELKRDASSKREHCADANVLLYCIVVTRFSSLRGRMASKLHHNPLTIDLFVVRTLRLMIRAKINVNAFVNKASKIAS
jgi:hypothetical protein